MDDIPAARRSLRAVLVAGVALILALLLPAAPAWAGATRDADGGGWQLPLPGSPQVLRLFDPPAKEWGAGHRGVDLAAAPGTDVLAAGPGVVAFSGQVGGRGVVTVRHGELRTTYEPVHGTVGVGTRVRAGTVIGRLEAGTHCGKTSCLHWGLLRGEEYLDPLSLVRRAPSRLLPVWGLRWGAPATASPRPSAHENDRHVPRARPTLSPASRSEQRDVAGRGHIVRHPVAAAAATTPFAAGLLAVAGHRRRHRPRRHHKRARPK